MPSDNWCEDCKNNQFKMMEMAKEMDMAKEMFKQEEERSRIARNEMVRLEVEVERLQTIVEIQARKLRMAEQVVGKELAGMVPQMPQGNGEGS